MPRKDPEERRAALKAALERHGLKPGPLAKQAGIPSSTLYAFLNGKAQDMGSAVYEALADATGISIDQLIGRETDIDARVLTAAAQALETYRPDAVTLEQVAMLADLQPSVVQDRYRDMRQIMRALVRRRNEALFDMMIAYEPPDGPLRDRLEAWYSYQYDRTNSRVGRLAAVRVITWEWAPDLEARYLKRLGDLRRHMASLFETARDRGELKDGDYVTAARLLHGASLLTYRQALHATLSPAEMVDIMMPAIDVVLCSFEYRLPNLG